MKLQDYDDSILRHCKMVVNSLEEQKKHIIEDGIVKQFCAKQKIDKFGLTSAGFVIIINLDLKIVEQSCSQLEEFDSELQEVPCKEERRTLCSTLKT